MSGRKAGRPSNAAIAERERRKRAWRREQEQRRQLESCIKRGLVGTIAWDEAIVRLGDLRDDVLVRAAHSPTLQFVLDRIKGTSSEQFDAALHKALCELLASDLPLDRDIRSVIAGALWRLAHPEAAKRASPRTKVRFIKLALAELVEHRGVTVEQARNQLAEGFGHASGESLRKWMDAHEHLLDDV